MGQALERRLTMAAFDLLNSTERIIDIALKYGYESQDAFTRAFKKSDIVLNVIPSIR